MSKTRIWIGLVLVFTVFLGCVIMSRAEEHIVNGATNVALIFDVYGASSGDPCLVEDDITAWNLKYYVDGATGKDVNNAIARHTRHARGQIKSAPWVTEKWWAVLS